MGLFSLAKLFGMTIRESANDGSDFTNPDADYRRLFLGEDGQLHVKDSAGTVTDIGASSGAVATDAIWDAAGDIVQGTGANTAAKLSAGLAGQTLRSAGAAAANAWAYPPGYEFSYAEITSDVAITATTEAGANTVVTAGAVTFDGSTAVMIEFYASGTTPPSVAGDYLAICLYDGATSIGYLALPQASGVNLPGQPIHAARRITPSNASHTYSIRAFVTANPNGVVNAGNGTIANRTPAFIRITKA